MYHPLLSARLWLSMTFRACVTYVQFRGRVRHYIVVDGEKYYWQDGEVVMFAETYIHQAANRTDLTRVILFCDIERPLSNSVLRWINRTPGRRMIRAAATQNAPCEHIGVLNHIFSYVYQIRAPGERINEWNKSIYYALKWSARGALLCADCRILKHS